MSEVGKASANVEGARPGRENETVSGVTAVVGEKGGKG